MSGHSKWHNIQAKKSKVDAKRGKIAFRTARIAHRHTEGTLTIAVQGYRSHVFGMVGNIVGRVVGRTVVFAGIDTEYGEVARMAWPYPVVSVPAELAH